MLWSRLTWYCTFQTRSNMNSKYSGAPFHPHSIWYFSCNLTRRQVSVDIKWKFALRKTLESKLRTKEVYEIERKLWNSFKEKYALDNILTNRRSLQRIWRVWWGWWSGETRSKCNRSWRGGKSGNISRSPYVNVVARSSRISVKGGFNRDVYGPPVFPYNISRIAHGSNTFSKLSYLHCNQRHVLLFNWW